VTAVDEAASGCRFPSAGWVTGRHRRGCPVTGAMPRAFPC